MFLVAAAPTSHPDLLLLASLCAVPPIRVETGDKTPKTRITTREESLTEPSSLPAIALPSDMPPSDILTLEDDRCAAHLVLHGASEGAIRWEALPQLLFSFLVFGSLFSLILFFGYILRDDE
ncbi:MAG: uncharacterized protein KVP18_004211 [Porospora cf. gigantea A]|uniref:uncharacterized protein n=1 Tax=Porospora cf. gigantea A TaxID=2853593 RepID=UPI00355999EF|nr:MAG: hypothetical protein KVP18_004211 [Porospora cf. gigantea A]